MDMKNQDFTDSEIHEELKKFDESKAGVKGLVDSGISKIPKFFIHPQEKLPTATVQVQLPVVNLEGFENGTQRAKIVAAFREASESWGFFQIANHGIPTDVLDGVLEGVKKFHEQPKEVKVEFYTRDVNDKQRVKYYSCLDMYVTKIGQWRDSFACYFEDGVVNREGLPLIFRDPLCDYLECLIKLKNLLAELLSEALGLSSDHLGSLKCFETQKVACHYSPPCPEPELTLSTTKHTDPTFLTILLQDHIGGLQIMHQNQWLDVAPAKGHIIVNIGDLLQLITNDKFKSVYHRVLAKHDGPRISVASFLYPSTDHMTKLYGPIKELVLDDNQQKYREVSTREFLACHFTKGLDGAPALPHFSSKQ